MKKFEKQPLVWRIADGIVKHGDCVYVVSTHRGKGTFVVKEGIILNYENDFRDKICTIEFKNSNRKKIDSTKVYSKKPIIQSEWTLMDGVVKVT